MEKRLKKMVLVGPIYHPYKGRIAHYTSLLYTAARQISALREQTSDTEEIGT